MTTSAPDTKDLAYWRCPDCDGVVAGEAAPRCPTCRGESPVWKWYARTHRFPVQPEEVNGGLCLDCGESVVLHLGDAARARLVPLVPIPVFPILWVMLGVASGFAPPRLGAIVGLAVFALGLGLLLAEYHRRLGGPRLRRSILVLCPACGFVRVDGVSGDATARRFERGRSRFDSLHRWSAIVTAFFAVVWLGGTVVGSPATPVTVLSFGAAAVIWVSVRAYRRSWYSR